MTQLVANGQQALPEFIASCNEINRVLEQTIGSIKTSGLR